LDLNTASLTSKPVFDRLDVNAERRKLFAREPRVQFVGRQSQTPAAAGREGVCSFFHDRRRNEASRHFYPFFQKCLL
jgi:hypothetical protein